MQARRSCIYRFGAFELDPQTGELRKEGVQFRLSPQPAEVLRILIENAGRLVPRNALRERLGGDSSFGDFDHALNNAILRIREVLNDSPPSPRFIETLPRRGYRFIAPVEIVEVNADAALGPDSQTSHQASPRRSRVPTAVAIGLALLLIASGISKWLIGRASSSERRPHRLIVLPFRNLEGIPANDYLAEGITEEVTTTLGRLKSIQVLSPNSATRFNESGQAIVEAAEKFQVDRIVQGTVQQSGTRVRVTVQLIQPRDGRQIWTEEYNRDVSDVLGLQDEIALSLSRQLDVRKEELQHLTGTRKIDPEAQLLYAKAVHGCRHYSQKTYPACVELLQQAIAKDPTYAEAYATLALTYDQLELHGILPAVETMPKAKAAAAKAMELDPSLAVTHIARAVVLVDYDWDASAAEKELFRASELEPSSSSAHHQRGWILMALGKWDEAVREFTTCLELYPMAPEHIVNLGIALTRAGRWDEAEKFLKAAVELAPDDSGIHYLAGYSYWLQRRYDDSIREFAAAAKGNPSGRLGYAYTSAGRKTDALAMLQRIKEERVTEGETAYDHAVMYAGIGDTEHALELLDQAYKAHCQCMIELQHDTMLQPLNTDPRFQQLLRRVGFSPHS